MQTAIEKEIRVSRIEGQEVWHRWTRLWNGEYELAPGIVGDRFGLFLTAAVHTDPATIHDPQSVSAWIRDVRSKFSAIRYSTVAGPYVDTEAQVVTCGWDAHGVFAGTSDIPGDEAGKSFHITGTDILQLKDGKIAGCRTMSNPARPE